MKCVCGGGLSWHDLKASLKTSRKKKKVEGVFQSGRGFKSFHSKENYLQVV